MQPETQPAQTATIACARFTKSAEEQSSGKRSSAEWTGNGPSFSMLCRIAGKTSCWPHVDESARSRFVPASLQAALCPQLSSIQRWPKRFLPPARSSAFDGAARDRHKYQLECPSHPQRLTQPTTLHTLYSFLRFVNSPQEGTPVIRLRKKKHHTVRDLVSIKVHREQISSANTRPD